MIRFRKAIGIIVLFFLLGAVTGLVTANQPPSAPALVFPTDGASGVPASPTLEWEAVDGATSYHVQVFEVTTFGNPIFTIAELWSVQGTSYEPGHLPSLNQYATPGTYQWRVRARNAAGLGAWSQTATFTIDPGPIQPPNLKSPPDGAVNQPTTLTLDWWSAFTGGLGGVVSYHLQVATDDEFSALVVDTPGILYWPWAQTVSHLDPGTTYFWRVSASTSSRPSAGWNTRSFTTAP
jgi:hypothetical protein